MTMVLPTFVETKVGRAEGLSRNRMRTQQDSVMKIQLFNFSISSFLLNECKKSDKDKKSAMLKLRIRRMTKQHNND